MSKSTRRLLIALVIIAAVVTVLIGTGIIPIKGLAFLKPQQEPIVIAVVAPWDGDDYNKEMELSIKLLVDQVNANGGVNGHPIELRAYTETDAADAQASAEKIAASDALIAIGFTGSGTTLAASPIYKEKGVPAITISASHPEITKNNDWFFSLINSNETMGKYAAGYVSEVLGSKKATVIYQEDDYGKSLKDAFVDWFERLGGEVVYTASLNYDDDPSQWTTDSQAMLSDISALEGGDPGVVFLALNFEPAQGFVRAMRDKGEKFTVIGAEDTRGDSFATTGFAELPNEILHKGYYTDGIYALPPIIFDVIGKMGQDFHKEYGDHLNYQSIKYGTASAPEELTWFGGLSYDTALMAVEALRKANITGDLASDREKVKKALASFNSYDNGVDGVSGKIYFNKDRVFEHPVSVGVYQNQKFISAPVQIQPIPSSLDTSDLGDQIIQIGDESLFKTRVVYVGMDINNIGQIDVDGARQYSMDFYIWFRYYGSADVEKIEFPNAASEIILSNPISEADTPTKFGIEHYRAYRVSADFGGDFNFRDYPFDEQSLTINFRHKNLQRSQMIYVIDYLGMGDIQSKTIYKGLTDEAGNFPNVSDWKPANNAAFFIDAVQDDSTLGNPELFNAKENKIEYSQFNATVDVKRDVLQFIMKSLFPVLFIITLTYLGLFLPRNEIGTIATSITGSVLSIVLFHVDLSGRLNVGYSVALDNAFYAIYALLVVELLLSIVAWHKKAEIDRKYEENEKIEKDEEKLDTKKDEIFLSRLLNTARIIYPLIIIGGGLSMLWLYKVI